MKYEHAYTEVQNQLTLGQPIVTALGAAVPLSAAVDQIHLQKPSEVITGILHGRTFLETALQPQQTVPIHRLWRVAIYVNLVLGLLGLLWPSDLWIPVFNYVLGAQGVLLLAHMTLIYIGKASLAHGAFTRRAR